MNKERVLLWIESLESEEYEQGTGRLVSKDDRFCCLGVACNVAIENGCDCIWVGDDSDNWEIEVSESKPYPHSSCGAEMPYKILDWYGITETITQRELWKWNDTEKLFFPEIAKKLRIMYGL